MSVGAKERGLASRERTLLAQTQTQAKVERAHKLQQRKQSQSSRCMLQWMTGRGGWCCRWRWRRQRRRLRRSGGIAKPPLLIGLRVRQLLYKCCYYYSWFFFFLSFWFFFWHGVSKLRSGLLAGAAVVVVVEWLLLCQFLELYSYVWLTFLGRSFFWVLL